jgi:ABC-2 type transport system permease protein
MAYMLLGAVFLGVGAQASTVREIQMLSLPITIVQVGMFGLSSAAASSPGSTLAFFAQLFPLSSPFAMAARGATDPRLWPHLLALGWQLLWVALTITVAARLFRRGVLKSGSGGFKGLFGRKRNEGPDDAGADSLTQM